MIKQAKLIESDHEEHTQSGVIRFHQVQGACHMCVDIDQLDGGSGDGNRSSLVWEKGIGELKSGSIG